MALPLINTPKYEVTLPVSKKTVEYRPFLVKEEKVMLQALQDNNDRTTFNAIKDLVHVCTFEKIDISKIAQADAEYLFMMIRNKSMGEGVEVIGQCTKCGAKTEIELDLSQIVVEGGEENLDGKIKLSEDCTIVMHHPSIELFFSENAAENLVAKSIDFIQIKDKLYEAKDLKLEEIQAFIDNLTKPQELMIEDFLASAPVLTYRQEFGCISCGEKNHIELRGIGDFFG